MECKLNWNRLRFAKVIDRILLTRFIMDHSVVSFSVTAVTPNPGYNVTTVFEGVS